MSKPVPTPAPYRASADRATHRFLDNVSGVNLSRLFAVLIEPTRRLTPAEKRLAEYVMDAAHE